MLPVPRHSLVLALATAVLAVAMPLAQAQAQDARQESMRAGMREMPRSRAQEGAMRGNVGSLSDSVRRVQRETGGRILGAERVPYDGRDINRVKYMDGRGRVRYMDDTTPQHRTPRRPHQVEQPPHRDNP
ncbi:hypothetical protein [Stenotrophomonas mori]|uniref:hypothetical protein n=1 Tax=Stenotrophomonas mori TaxID=2871096 RepID=UPI003CE5AE20